MLIKNRQFRLWDALKVVGVTLVNNFVLVRFLGICPYIGVSQKIETATGMGMAVIFVMTLAGVVTWALQSFVLIPLGLEYLQTIVFILVIATLVQFVEIVIQKMSPVLYQALGIYLPLITTNCAVLGMAVLSIQQGNNLLRTAFFAFGAAVGFAIAIVLFAGIRERLDLVKVPASLKGAPIGLITAGILSLGFMGFANLVKG